jgi:hypothetical protein
VDQTFGDRAVVVTGRLARSVREVIHANADILRNVNA